MRRLSLEARAAARTIAEVLPETLIEAEKLAARVEAPCSRRPGRGVQGLCVEIRPDGVLLRGRCTTYYCKQLAQHAAMAVSGSEQLCNQIEVG